MGAFCSFLGTTTEADAVFISRHTFEGAGARAVHMWFILQLGCFSGSVPPHSQKNFDDCASGFALNKSIYTPLHSPVHPCPPSPITVPSRPRSPESITGQQPLVSVDLFGRGYGDT